MLAYISALILLGLALLAVVLQKTYYFFPVKELKRQARSGDKLATVLFRAVAYGGSLRLLLWILIGLTVAGAFVLLQIAAPTWLVFIAVTGLIWYGFAWSPNAQVTPIGAKVVVVVTPIVAWTLYYTHPLLDRFVRFMSRHRPVTFHTGLYEREDLQELIESQRRLPDSRISPAELDIVLHALSFGEKTVQSIMIPKRSVKTVSEADVIGPILMDELYESKHTRFPVVSADDRILGVLFLRNVVASRHGGVIRDVMKPTVNYVHEDQTLYQVLHAFLTTKHQLFVVINSHQNYVGVVTIEDVLEQIIGHKIENDFDAYDDPKAVAAAAAVVAKTLKDDKITIMKTSTSNNSVDGQSDIDPGVA